MVHFQDSSMPLKANYWKLFNWRAEDCTVAVLEEELENADYQTQPRLKKSRLLQLLSRAERGLISYDGRSPAELRNFCEQHRLGSIRATHMESTLAHRLEAADDVPTFDKFLDLLAEIRVEINRFHTDWLRRPHRAGAPPSRSFITPPPVTQVSRLLREESLPSFYEEYRPELQLFSPSAEVGTERGSCWSNSKNLFTIPKLSHLYKHLRDLDISVYITEVRIEKVTATGRLRMQVEFGNDGKVKIRSCKAVEGALKVEWVGRAEELKKQMVIKMKEMAGRTGMLMVKGDGAGFVRT